MEKTRRRALCRFWIWFFSNTTAVVRDPSNGNAKPFEIVDSSRAWKIGDVRIYARNGTQKVEIGKIERAGCKCQGLHKISLPNGGIYYTKNFTGMLGNYAVSTRFITILAQNLKPLIHWSQNSGLASIYTHHVTLMLLILAQQTASFNCFAATTLMEPTIAQLYFV